MTVRPPPPLPPGLDIMRYTIRWWYLLKLSVLLAVAGGAVYGVHRWQAGRQTGAFLHQADLAKEGGKANDEAEFLRRYLVARPDDTDARERLGRLLPGLIRTRADVFEAYLVMDDVLRRDPSREGLRRFAADYAMQVGMLVEAEGQLEVLVKAHPEDGELAAKSARCLAQARKFPEAAARLRAAVKANPAAVEPYVELAALLRGPLNRPAEADEVMAGLLRARPDDYKAQLAAYRYWRAAGGRKQAAVVAAKAVAEAQQLPPGETVAGAVGRVVALARRLAPDDLGVLVAAASDALDRARDAAGAGDKAGREEAVKDARGLSGRAVQIHPKLPGAYLVAASVEADTKDPAAAVAVVKRGLEEAPQSADLAVALLDYQVRVGDPAGVAEALDRVKKSGQLKDGRADYYQAYLLALRDEWEEAEKATTGLLARAGPELADPAVARQVNLLHAKACEQLGEYDRALAAYKKAQPGSPADPGWAQAYTGEAVAEFARGNLDEALAAYKKAKDGNPGAWLGVARLEVAKVLRSPKDKWDWAAAEAALGMADKALPGATDVALLRANLAYLQGRKDEARRLLDGLRAERPKETAVWVAAAVQDLREGSPEQAGHTLDAALAAAGDSAELRLARAQVLADAHDPQLAPKLAALAADAHQLGKGGEKRLLRGLAETASAAGAAGAAAELWDKVAGVQGYNLGVHLRRFDLAVRAADPAGMDRVLADIRRVDGANGQTARLASALALVWKAQKGNDPAKLEEARVILDGLERDRPQWGRASLALADVLYLQQKPAAAMAKYQKAVSEGVIHPEALRRLTELLRAANRLAEAEQVFRKLPAEFADRPENQRLEAQLLSTRDPRRALDRLDKAVPADSKDVNDQLWRGGVAWAAREPEKAAAAFQKAVELKPDLPAAWLALVRFQAGTGKRAEAEKAAADGAAKVPAADRDLYEATAAAYLGKVDEAAAKFQKAREAQPTALKAVQGEAEFLFSAGRLKAAGEGFHRVLALKDITADEKAFATRMLVVCLAADRDPQTSRQALELLGLLDKDGNVKPPPADETPAQRKNRILALSFQKDRPSKLEAIRLLKENEAALDPAELFLLAQLYAAVGDQREVPLVMAALIDKTRATPVPMYLARHADWLLKNRRSDQAEEHVKRLAELQPTAFQTAELKARLAMAKNDPAAARAALLPLAEGPAARPGAAPAVARVLEAVGLLDDAERLFRQALAAAPADGKGAAGLILAGFLGRRGKTAEALSLADQARSAKLQPTVVGGVCIGILYSAPTPDPADAARVVGWLEEAAKAAEPTTKAALAAQAATVKNLAGDYKAAITLYEQTLKTAPKDVPALNNLGYLIAAYEKRYPEALALLERAKKEVGPDPELLDTEAQILLLADKPLDARERMLVAAVEVPSGTKLFHLAQAEQRVGNKPDARTAWDRAHREFNLKRTDLHPFERPAYDELATALR